MSLVQVRQAGSVKMLEPRGKQWEVTLKDAFCPIPFTHCKCSAWTGLVSRHEDLFLPLYIRASVQMAEMGWSSPTQLRGFSLSRIHCQKKKPKSQTNEQPGTFLVWSPASHMGHTTSSWSLQPTSSGNCGLYGKLTQRRSQREAHAVILGFKSVFSKDVQIPLKTQPKDSWKLPAAERFQSGDSSMTKGGKILFTTSLRISQTLGWVFKSPRRKFPLCRKIKHK